jgi:hypothetical protein
MNNNKQRLLRKGGFVADYATVSTPNDYMLYIPPPPDSATSSSEGAVLVSTNTPGMVKGGAAARRRLSGGTNLPNNFYYSMKGGCSMCSNTPQMKGGNANNNANNAPKKQLKGGFGLEPFITALALLGARMLADKEVGLFTNDKKSSKRFQEEED